MKKFYCACCARQIIENPWSKDLTAPKFGAVSLGFNAYCCGDCAKDLDENGLFPEEYALI